MSYDHLAGNSDSEGLINAEKASIGIILAMRTPRVTPHRASTVSDIPGPEASISATSKPAGVAALSLLSRNTL